VLVPILLTGIILYVVTLKHHPYGLLLSTLYKHPFSSYDIHTLTAIGNTNSLLAIAHAQYHVTYLQGVDINHIF